MLNFTVNISEKASIPIVYVVGEVDAHTSPELNETLIALIENGKKNIIININDVGFIDSAGVGAIARSAQTLLNKHQEQFKVVCDNTQLKRIFDVSGLSGNILQFYEQETEALKAVEKE